MSELDEPLRGRLERLVPTPGREELDWEDTLLRAGRLPSRSPRRGRLTLVLIAVALVAVVATPLGGAIANGVGDFSAWLRGEPGQPAAPADQEAFDRSNERSFAGFPRGTQLRRLIETEVDGRRLELFGFRSGGSLCLRLVLRGLGQPQTGCAPVAELERATAPAVVVLSDASFGRQDVPPTEEGYVPALAAASFGIVADGVREVELVDGAGRHQALLGGNAFLAVVERPKLGQRTRSGSVVAADGTRLPLAVARAPFGERGAPAAKPGTAPGPTKVERVVEGGKIGWLERRELRGEAPPADARYLRGPSGPFEFARILTPDPASHVRIMVGIGTLERFLGRPKQPSVCVYLLSDGGAGGGCNPLANPFPRGPLMAGQSVSQGGDQFATIHGAAADEVARIHLFLGSGAHVTVPLRDNTFFVQVPRTQFPARLVAYDSQDMVIGIEHFASDPLAQTGPRPVGRWRLVATARAETGEIARLRLARGSNGGTCYTLRITGGAGGSGCSPRRDFSGPPLQLGVNSTPTAQFLSGQVMPGITKVDVRLADGSQLELRVVKGFVLVALPPDLKPVEAVGVNAAGATVARYRFISGP